MRMTSKISNNIALQIYLCIFKQSDWSAISWKFTCFGDVETGKNRGKERQLSENLIWKLIRECNECNLKELLISREALKLLVILKIL